MRERWSSSGINDEELDSIQLDYERMETALREIALLKYPGEDGRRLPHPTTVRYAAEVRRLAGLGLRR